MTTVREKLDAVKLTLDIAKSELEGLKDCVDIDDYKIDLKENLIKAIETVQAMM